MEENIMAANAESVANSQTVGATETTAAESGVSQQTEQTTQTDVTQTQAFARRLKEATTEAEQRARDALIAELYGETYGIRTYAEYQEAIRRQQEEAQRQRYQEAGLDPDMVKQIAETLPEVKWAREFKQKQEAEAKFQAEATELFEMVPDLKPEDIQPEVWRLREEKGISLADAYLRVNWKNMRTQSEQEAIKKLTQTTQSSTGSLSGGDVQHNQSISKMPKADFDKLVESVLRGETKTF